MSKPIAWSWSRLSMFEQCPKRFWGNNVGKVFPKPNFEAAHFKKGKAVHKVLEDYLRDGTTIPFPVPEINGPEKFYVKLEFLMPLLDKMRKANTVLPELQVTFDIRMHEVSWFDKKAWCRVVLDALIIVGEFALVIDWKTGKVKQHSDQLKLFAGAVLSKYKKVNRVLTAYVWCEHENTSPTYAEYSRKDMEAIWQDFGDRQELIQMCNESGNWPAKPNHLCGWCEAREDQCEHKST